MSDEDYMRRALALAATMKGRTGVNPTVGCVIVKNGAIISEGVTQEGGRPHAEEMALQGVQAAGATAYVTLEPCAQRSAGGPSCADLLVDANVIRVVIATRDPHPKAGGVSIRRLAETGTAVEVGLLEDEARAMNADFLTQWES